jgi:DNA repair protein RadC
MMTLGPSTSPTRGLLPTELADHELVAYVVGARLSDEGWRRARDRLGGLGGLGRAHPNELARAVGLTEARARRLLAAVELGRRVLTRPMHVGEPIRSPEDVTACLGPLLVDRDAEELHVLGLDARGRLLDAFVAGRGGLNLVYAEPRDLFRPLVRMGAVSAILVHNHPSGDPTPSESDVLLTERVLDAGLLLGVRLVDHVIVARSGSFSFAGHPEYGQRIVVRYDAEKAREARHPLEASSRLKESDAPAGRDRVGPLAARRRRDGARAG